MAYRTTEEEVCERFWEWIEQKGIADWEYCLVSHLLRADNDFMKDLPEDHIFRGPGSQARGYHWLAGQAEVETFMRGTDRCFRIVWMDHALTDERALCRHLSEREEGRFIGLVDLCQDLSADYDDLLERLKDLPYVTVTSYRNEEDSIQINAAALCTRLEELERPWQEEEPCKGERRPCAERPAKEERVQATPARPAKQGRLQPPPAPGK